MIINNRILNKSHVLSALITWMLRRVAALFAEFSKNQYTESRALLNCATFGIPSAADFAANASLWATQWLPTAKLQICNQFSDSSYLLYTFQGPGHAVVN